VYEALSEPDFIERIGSVCGDFDRQICASTLRSILRNTGFEREPRARALRALIELDLAEAEDLDDALSQQDTWFISEVIAMLSSSEKAMLTEEQIRLLFSNPKLPKSSTGLGRMIAQFIQRGADYTTAVFLPGA